MGGGASAPGGNMGGVPPTVLGGAEFMQGVFTANEQVVKNTLQSMQVPVRMAESRATMAIKAFLQLRPPTFKGEPDPFAKAFVSTEEEKAKQFMRGLRPSIRNKLARNLIKVYSTMVSVAATIEETLNETRKIQNPKSQREGTSNQSEGRSSKKPRNSITQQQYPASGLPTRGSAATVVAEGTISHPSTGTITSQGATFLLSVWSGWSYQSIVHVEGEQLGSYGIATTYSINSGLEGHSSIYISTYFISVQTTSCSSAGLEDAGTGLRYNLSSRIVGGSGTAGAAIGYLCCTRYFTYV
ncbi:hypothetical protein Acr_23g0000640 [Actinidia rufa]|uniref:Uncharacterized protein n=1 Tax=Actinidia rufa TaxID=165716 RepID=A0A7J0GLH7_9ERIC|nr:hypothetical protein Acr_23g0000640 [Actinidia rufa]